MSTGIDPSLAFVLEGSFAIISGGESGSDTVHRERITLMDLTAAGSIGMAKVEQKDDGEQQFKTRSSGLDPGMSYQIWVDGFLTGVRTAGTVGQASLELEHPDDGDLSSGSRGSTS